MLISKEDIISTVIAGYIVMGLIPTITLIIQWVICNPLQNKLYLIPNILYTIILICIYAKLITTSIEMVMDERLKLKINNRLNNKIYAKASQTELKYKQRNK
jgi:hypothetical protein